MNFLKHYIKKIFSLAKRIMRKYAPKEVSEEAVQREHEIAVETLKKGENFIRTALLLRKNNSDENVVLSMICQGIENILKGLLLAKDYVRYEPLLRRKFGKNLLRLYYRTRKEYKIKNLNARAVNELQILAYLYKNQFLHYGHLINLLNDDKAFESGHLLKKLFQILAYVKKRIY
jgi:DNA polymerase III delta prime subunit